MIEKIREALIYTEMEMGLSNVDPEILQLLDILEVIEFNKMGYAYWYEVDECIDYYFRSKNYFQFVKLFL